MGHRLSEICAIVGWYVAELVLLRIGPKLVSAEWRHKRPSPEGHQRCQRSMTLSLDQWPSRFSFPKGFLLMGDKSVGGKPPSPAPFPSCHPLQRLFQSRTLCNSARASASHRPGSRK
uniref:Putative secreted protein n=1 Tax=Anopheles marajoara TaxID=58244 RepID=A0A2M4C7D2_9DIPT